MMTLASLTLLLGLAAPVTPAQDQAPAAEQQATPPMVTAESVPAPAFSLRQLDFGVQGVETDTASSRFREYRDVPTGVNLSLARFAGRTDELLYDVAARNVLQDDAAYHVLLAPDAFRLSGSYVKMPHRFGNDARSLLQRTAPGVYSISDTLQQAFQDAIQAQRADDPGGVNFNFLSALVGPSLAAQDTFDLSLLRERGRVELQLTPDQPVDVRLTYFHEKRRGQRGAGTTFGFSNVVESPEPIDYRTQDYGASVEWQPSWGLLRGAFNYNQFTNNIPVHEWDNPFRAVSSTDGRAYLSPGGASIGGPAFGRAALPPDNKAVTGSVGLVVKFAGHSRWNTSVSLGQWTQDASFIAHTTNEAVHAPGLPAASLDGKIDTLSFSTGITSRPVKGLTLRGTVRRYDLDNKTPRLRFEDGYVRFDAVLEHYPRISVPYGYTSDKLNLGATYTAGQLTLEGGWRHSRMERTFRETEQTTQNIFLGRVDLRASDWVVLRGSLETGSRDYDHYDPHHSEEASFLDPGAPANLQELRRYDQAKKDVQRYGAHLVLTPAGTATLTLSYLKGKDDYTETSYGLISSDSETLSVDADYTPNERINLFGYYTREDYATFQRGRQSGGTLSTNPLDDWTALVDDKVDTFGGGGTFSVVREKLDLKLAGSFQTFDGNNDIQTPPGGRTAAGIPLFDDTDLLTLSGELTLHVNRELSLAAGGWFEDYEIQDSSTSGLVNYVPGSFFLAADNGDYQAHVLYLRMTYAW